MRDDSPNAQSVIAHELTHFYYYDVLGFYEKDLCITDSKKWVLSEMLIPFLFWDFYEKTGGGLTVSGGEPVCQLEGLKDLLKISRESGIGTAIETSLNYDYSDIEELFPYLDLVIADCKAVSEDVHIKCTGVSNKRILKNIKRLSDEHKRVWIRIPVVPGVNITPDEMRLIGDFLSDINVELIELLPYHKMGADKYRTWGMEYILDQATEPSESYMGMCYNILSGKCRNVIRQEDKNG